MHKSSNTTNVLTKKLIKYYTPIRHERTDIHTRIHPLISNNRLNICHALLPAEEVRPIFSGNTQPKYLNSGICSSMLTLSLPFFSNQNQLTDLRPFRSSYKPQAAPGKQYCSATPVPSY